MIKKTSGWYTIVLCSFWFFPGILLGNNILQQEINILTQRLQETLSDKKINPKELDSSLAYIRPDGSWTDIDYETVTINYNALKHLSRLLNMALLYSKPESTHYKSSTLLQQILHGLEYFFQKQPVSLNWWYNEIGAPQEYMCILLLLKNDIEKNQLLRYSSYLKDRTPNPGHQGKNRTWVSKITIFKGCIEDNYELISTGFVSIATTIKVIRNTNEEGIKSDFSIHQHRPQLYSGGYGMSFMEDLAGFVNLTNGLSFASLFTPEKREIISVTLLEGQMMFGYRSSYDFGTIGRNISRPNALNNISEKFLDVMISNDPGHATQYEAWKRHLTGAPFPVPGNKYFWKSAIMTHHGSNYYLSAKISSTRNNGTEMLNGENLKGYYLPLGATNILTSGEEYKDIFPVWDWTRIPGTTAVSNQSTTELRWYHFGSNRFGGGVSNSGNGIIAYEHAYNGVEAWKSYFFFGDAMLCLGSGISADKTNMITTSVNQCLLNGEIYINQSGITEKFTEEIIMSDHLKWVHHDNVGYIFPEQKSIILQQKNSPVVGGKSTATEIRKIFPEMFLVYGNNMAPILLMNPIAIL